MKKDNRIYLRDILTAIEKIERYLGTMDYTKFSTQEVIQDAVVRQLEIVGEATNRLSDDFIATHPDFPVREAVAMRNFLIHGYDDVNMTIVWATIQNDLPSLKAKVSALL